MFQQQFPLPCVQIYHFLTPIDFLTGSAREPRLLEVTLALAAQMLTLAGLAPNLADAERRARAVLDSGAAAERFARMVAGLGGPTTLLSRRFAGLAQAPVTIEVPAPANGFITAMDTRAIGLAVNALGGGRLRAADAIDARVGYSHLSAIGSAVQRHEPLARVHARNRDEAITARERLLAAIVISDEKSPDSAIVRWASAPG